MATTDRSKKYIKTKTLSEIKGEMEAPGSVDGWDSGPEGLWIQKRAEALVICP